MKRVTDPDDPQRCRSVAADGGQCQNYSTEDYDYCEMHGGATRGNPEKMAYLSEQFANRMKISAGELDEIKLLRENLINLNAVIAAHVNLIKDQSSLLTHADPVARLMMQAEKVTVSLHRLSTSSSFLLAKPALVTWGQEIMSAVAETIEDKYEGWEDDLHDLAGVIGDIIVNIENKENDK